MEIIKLESMKFILGTKNEAKKRAVLKWIEAEGFEVSEVIGVSVDSGIDEMPFSDEDCIKGALNRAKNALAESEGFDYGIGMEGGVCVKADMMFLVGWVAIVDVNGAIGVASSGHIEVPDFIRKELENGKELGPLMAELHDKDVRNLEGAMGIFSGGRVSRSDSFVKALRLAYSKLDNELYTH